MKRPVIILVLAMIGLSAAAQTTKWKITKDNRSSFQQATVMNDMKEGDCWDFSFPVEKLKAGTLFEFDLVIGTQPGSPKYFAVEYLDGKQWKQAEGNLHRVPENPELSYNVKCTGKPSQTFNVIQTIRLEKPIRKGQLKIRLRAVGDISCDGSKLSDGNPENEVMMKPYGYIGGYAKVLGTSAPKDTVRIGWIGNSFTFVNAADFIFKELAYCEGHYIDLNVNVYPGARFRNHLSMSGSMDIFADGGYEWFILQDQSQQSARYGRDKDPEIINYTKSVADVIRYFSPECKIILEQTWAFSKDDFGGFGSFEEFDRCATAGADEIARKAEATVSPIAQAFAIIRSERPDIEIYSTDYHHPAAFGAYVKACVNYLTIFGEPFHSDQANFALDPEICAYLRKVAERVCLK